MGFKLDQCLTLTIFILLLTNTICELLSKNCNCDSPNVRTVLFKATDIQKECWNQEELALLYTRRLMQEILPRKVPKNMDLLMDFIKMCLKTLQQEVTSKHAHHILLLAMTDTLGGYLQTYGFPITKQKYYEGTVNYCVAKQMNELLDTTKQVLQTDGGGWTRPIFVKKSKIITPFIVPSSTKENACSTLITSYDMLSCAAQIKPDVRATPSVHIPLPFLDSAVHPCAIALPFRNRSLFSLLTKDSSDILLRYYTAAIHCLQRPADIINRHKAATCSDKNAPAIQQFNVDFHHWLIKVVLPHLHDEKWYPGFGSVRRILETMSASGIKTAESSNSIYSIDMAESNVCHQTALWFYVLCVVLFILLFWLCVCCVCIFSRLCRKRSDTLCSHSSSSGHVVDALLHLYEGSYQKSPDRYNKSPSGYKNIYECKKRSGVISKKSSSYDGFNSCHHLESYGRMRK